MRVRGNAVPGLRVAFARLPAETLIIYASCALSLLVTVHAPGRSDGGFRLADRAATAWTR